MARRRTVYFAMIDGHETGPMTRAEFALRLASEMVDEETFVWKQGMSEWLPAAKVQELAGMLRLREEARRQGVRPPPPPPAAKAKSRSRAKREEQEEEEEVELELDLDRAPAAAAKGPPPPPKMSLPSYSLAAVRSRPRPPAPELAKPPPPPAPLVPDPPPPAPPPPEEEEDDERTTLELLPLGERVHQEEVAEQLFDPGEGPPTSSGSTGAVAIDSLRWAYMRAKKEESDRAKKLLLPSQLKPASTSVTPPPRATQPEVQRHPTAPARKRRRVDARTLAIVGLIAAAGLAFSVALYALIHWLVYS